MNVGVGKRSRGTTGGKRWGRSGDQVCATMAAGEAFADNLGGKAKVCCTANAAKIRGVMTDVFVRIQAGAGSVIGGLGRRCTDSRVATGLAPAECEGGK